MDKCPHCDHDIRAGYKTCGTSFCQELETIHNKARNTKSKKRRRELYAEAGALMASKLT